MPNSKNKSIKKLNRSLKKKRVLLFMCFFPIFYFLLFFWNVLNLSSPRPRNPSTQLLSHLRREISPTLVDQVQDLPESVVYLRPNEPTYLVLESPSLKLKLKRLTTSWLAFFGTKTDDSNQTTKFIRQFFFSSILTLVSNKK